MPWNRFSYEATNTTSSRFCNETSGELSPVARERLRILRLWDALRQKGTNSFEAAELLGPSRSTPSSP